MEVFKFNRITFCPLQDIMCSMIVWLVVLRTYVNLEIFHPYRDLEAGDNQSEIVAARPGIEPRTSCSASQEFNHCIIAAPNVLNVISTKCS